MGTAAANTPPEPGKIRLTFKVAGGASPELPIEIRRPDAALVARGTSRGYVDLDRGDYFVLARLPGGRTLEGQVSIENDVAKTHTFEDPKASRDPFHDLDHESVLAATREVRLPRVRITRSFPLDLVRRDAEVNLTTKGLWEVETAPGLESAYVPRDACRELAQDAKLEVLRIAPDFVDVRAVDRPHSELCPDSAGHISVRAGDPLKPGELRLVRYADPGRLEREEVLVWPFPDAAAAKAELRVIDRAPGLEAHLLDPQGDLTLQYWREALISEALASAQVVLNEADERLNQDKPWNPVAVALACYLHLANALESERLRGWIARLAEQHPGFPDALCLRAEILGRAGQVDAAVETLLGLSDLGLPFFAQGMSLACDRLAGYLRRVSAPRWDEAALLLARLNWLGSHRRIGEPVLTLEGFDPRDANDLGELRALRPEPRRPSTVLGSVEPAGPQAEDAQEEAGEHDLYAEGQGQA